jgi:hypothetical protein
MAARFQITTHNQMNKNKYSVAYFIRFFKSKAPRFWGCGRYKTSDGKGKVLCCALAFAHGMDKGGGLNSNTERVNALRALFDNTIRKRDYVSIVSINDSQSYAESYGVKGKHPRTRILNALRLIQKKAAK